MMKSPMRWADYEALVKEHEQLKRDRPDLVQIIAFVDRFRQVVAEERPNPHERQSLAHA